MHASLVWLIAGLILVIAELVTGTFYLLLLGVAALVAAGIAVLEAPFWVEAFAAAVVAVAGMFWVRRHRRTAEQGGMKPLDVGQPVTLDGWVNQADHLARVKYRDALWDARVDGDCRGERGEILYITAVQGSLLTVAKSRPA